MRALGLLSGTSADGVDAALVDFSTGKIRTLLAQTYSFPPAIRERILAAPNAKASEIADLHAALGEAFAAGAVRLLRAADAKGLARPAVIGSHGQTIFHIPGRASLQIGDAARIAARTGIPVVADFRAGDIARGGSGAPLVPILDEALFGRLPGGTVACNLGGIANVTHIRGGCVRAGFDTGPANAPLDAAMRLAGKGPYDKNGLLAMRGRTDPKRLADLLKDPYFARKPPKSLEREAFGAPFAKRLLDRLSLADLLSTLTDLAAETIAEAVKRFCRPCARLVLSGGGLKNITLISRLSRALERRNLGVSLESSDRYGVSPDAKEAVLFAFLAARRIEGRPGNLPAATGAKSAAVLGAVYHP